MKMQPCLIQELRLYMFKLGHNAVEAILVCNYYPFLLAQLLSYICHAKNEGTVKKFLFWLQKKNSMIRLGQVILKVDSMAMLQAIEANPAISTLRVSDKLSLWQSSPQQKLPLLLNYALHYQNIAKLLIPPSV